MTIKRLTAKQKEVLEFIVEFHTHNNKPPSFRDISSAMGYNVSNAYQVVQALSKKGYIKYNTILKGIKTNYEPEQ